MQTNFSMHNDPAIEGLTFGHRKTKPRHLPWLPQITRVTVTAGAATDDLVLTFVDDKTGQTYSVTATGDANEATLAAAAVAAIRAHARVNGLFSVVATQATSGQDVILDLTARHANRSYSISGTGGTGAVTISDTQAAGGDKLRFARFVARGSSDDEIVAVGASTTIGDLEGMLFRTDANHFHSFENDGPDEVDALDRGKTYPVLEDGRIWVLVEEDVTPASTPYLRRAQTSSAGEVGGLRASPDGSTQVATITAVADRGHYAVEFGYLGQHYSIHYAPTDATTTTDVAIDGLEAHAADVVPDGVTASSASATATMTLTAAAGTQFDYVRNGAYALDSAAAGTTVSVAAADVDAIDISAIARFESTASAGELAKLRVRMTA